MELDSQPYRVSYLLRSSTTVDQLSNQSIQIQSAHVDRRCSGLLRLTWTLLIALSISIVDSAGHVRLKGTLEQ